MSSRAHTLRNSLALSAVMMIAEPLVHVVALSAVGAGVFRLSRALPHGYVLAAVAMPLALAAACWLLSARLQQRAQTQEFLLTEVFLGLGGNLSDLFPPRRRTARERVERRTPLLQSLVSDALEMARETPCIWTRNIDAWIAIVFAGGAVGRWLWELSLHSDLISLLALAAVTPCSVVFAVAWNDLRRGRHRHLRGHRPTEPWAEGYRPESIATVIPTMPVLLLMFVPALSLGMIWANGNSVTERLNMSDVVFTLWVLLWAERARIASSTAFQHIEHLAAPMNNLLCRAAAPTWSLVMRVRRWSGWGSAALLMVAFSWPSSATVSRSSTVTSAAAWMFCVCVLLTPFAFNHTPQPVTARSMPAQQLLERQGELQARRISTVLKMCLGISLALTLLVAVPI